jgi:type IV pilus assembly protein PilB
MDRVRIGEMLLRRGHIDALQLESALAHQRRWGGRIGRAIVHLGFMKEETLLAALGEQLGVPFVEVGDRHVDRALLALVPERLVRTRCVLPLARLSEHRRGPLVVAVPDAGDLTLLDELSFATGLQIRPVLAAESDLERAIARLLDPAPRPSSDWRAHPAPIDVPADTSPLSAVADPAPARPRPTLQ